jgi:hypothetical protein
MNLSNSKASQLLIIGLIMSFMNSCVNNNSNQTTKQVDSLILKADTLEVMFHEKTNPEAQDSALPSAISVEKLALTEEKTPDIPTNEALQSSSKKKKPEQTEIQPGSIKAKTCEGCTYYNTGEVSVKKDPMDDRRRTKIHFYDKKGKETFMQEDVSQSSSVFTELTYRDNGSVSKASVSINPGASRYWYEQTIYFDEENYPTKKYTQRLPYDDLQSTLNKPEKWDRAQKQWVPDE